MCVNTAVRRGAPVWPSSVLQTEPCVCMEPERLLDQCQTQPDQGQDLGFTVKTQQAVAERQEERTILWYFSVCSVDFKYDEYVFTLDMLHFIAIYVFSTALYFLIWSRNKLIREFKYVHLYSSPDLV